jgi:hypothetical protein
MMTKSTCRVNKRTLKGRVSIITIAKAKKTTNILFLANPPTIPVIFRRDSTIMHNNQSTKRCQWNLRVTNKGLKTVVRIAFNSMNIPLTPKTVPLNKTL